MRASCATLGRLASAWSDANCARTVRSSQRIGRDRGLAARRSRWRATIRWMRASRLGQRPGRARSFPCARATHRSPRTDGWRDRGSLGCAGGFPGRRGATATDESWRVAGLPAPSGLIAPDPSAISNPTCALPSQPVRRPSRARSPASTKSRCDRRGRCCRRWAGSRGPRRPWGPRGCGCVVGSVSTREVNPSCISSRRVMSMYRIGTFRAWDVFS